MPLHINIEDLLSARTVESDRIEFKGGWNPDAIYRTICAFANDFDNSGGGYILIGVEEMNGIAKRPVKGLSASDIAFIQKKMIGFNNLINPVFFPKLFIEEVDGRQIIVLWIIGGSNRPYEVPEQITSKSKVYFYYIRRYASTIRANAEQTQELIGLANQIPFDDRPNRQATLKDISSVLVQDFLRLTRSRLVDWIEQRPLMEILEQMALLDGPSEHLFLRNAALLFFSENPEKFFPYTFIDLVYFPKGAADKQFTEKQFKGPVQQQIRQALSFIQGNLLQELVTKVKRQPEAVRVWNYPYEALEEALANCIYHRNYQEREPVTIRIEPDAIYIYNIGGPDRSIRIEDFQKGRVFPQRYRNKRVGDFLKELDLTEGRATGIPVILSAMKNNGSPTPHFETDDDRTWFRVTLHLHPAFAKANNNQQIGKINDNHIRLADLVTDLVTNLDTDLVTNKKNNQGFARILLLLYNAELTRGEIFKHLKLSNQTLNYKNYLEPLEKIGLIEKTFPDKPNSSKQKYRLTEKGRSLVEEGSI